MKKTICIVITNRANFARMKSLLTELKKSKKVNLKVILSGSALTQRYGNLEKILKLNKMSIAAKSFFPYRWSRQNCASKINRVSYR